MNDHLFDLDLTPDEIYTLDELDAMDAQRPVVIDDEEYER